MTEPSESGEAGMAEGASTMLTRWAGPVAITLVGIGTVWRTWLTWPDVLIDYGRELYVAWMLAEGKVLYRDVGYFYGCLSPYVNATLFELFGVGIRTLIIANLVMVSVLVWLLYRILHEIGGRLAAAVACLVFVGVFVAAQIDPIGNYNYITPYSHEMTHGVLLSVLGIYLLLEYLRRRRTIWIAMTGFVLGLVFLTKAEIFSAACAAISIGVGLSLWAQRTTREAVWRCLIAFGAAAVVPSLVAFVLLNRAMSVDDAFHGLLGSWPAVFNEEIRTLRLYRVIMGTLDSMESAKRIAIWLGWYAALFVPAIVLALGMRRSGKSQRVTALIGFAVVAAIMKNAISRTDWLANAASMLTPLPAILIVMCVTWFIKVLRQRRERCNAKTNIIRLTMSIFAFVLLGKMILNTSIFRYGFVLAMPATMLLIVAAVAWGPKLLTRLGGHGGLVQAGAIAVIVMPTYGLLSVANHWVQTKTHVVSSGSDVFLAAEAGLDERGVMVSEALKVVGDVVSPDQTLAVLPEGAMLNYLSRRANPTPYFHLMPPEMILYGEDRIVEAYRAAPPDFVALVHKSSAEYGVGLFGTDSFGRKLHGWVRENYRAVRLVGEEPLREESRFGILLLERIKRNNATREADEGL